jgi:hypothetical protein
MSALGLKGILNSEITNRKAKIYEKHCTKPVDYEKDTFSV